MDIVQVPPNFDTPKLCECGCGLPAPLAKKTDKFSGRVEGQPQRFIIGHSSRRPIEDRFWSKVVISDYCWLWVAYRNALGYGVLGSKRTSLLAHRYSYELAVGPIPPKFLVLHKCDNPPCVNPDHLFLGTHQDNCDDKIAKGRTNPQRGEQNGNAKLTIADVRNIRACLKQGQPVRQIARQFSITPPHVRYIRDRKLWTDID